MDLVRCPDLWFDDGSVVLQAEQTIFKVYRGPLQQHSPFFSDLFTLPQQERDGSEKYEGCPLVLMAGDTAQDATVFLKAIFNFQWVIKTALTQSPYSMFDHVGFMQTSG